MRLVEGEPHVIDIGLTDEPDIDALLSTQALDVLFPNWRESFGCNKITREPEEVRNPYLTRYKDVFTDRKKPMTGVAVKLTMKDAIPILAKPYALPPALAPRVKVALNKMVEDGILYPVENTKWASPMVVVVKRDKCLRICIDPSKTINPHLSNMHYPLPRIENLLMKFNGKMVFGLIDLKGAYMQLPVDEESQELLTINTPFGLYRYARLPFGISPAPSIFQRAMEKIFNGIDCVIYLDDILVVNSREKTGHVNQLSKYTFRHRLYDEFDPVRYQFVRQVLCAQNLHIKSELLTLYL